VNEIDSMISKMAKELSQIIDLKKLENPLVIGIHTGGVWLAEKLHTLLKIKDPLGMLDISFYRDDFTRLGLNPQVKPSKLPISVDNRNIILVDDVLYTGRTVRAALNEIFDYARPANVILAVLLDRAGRELPFEANVVGKHLSLADTEQVKLSGPEPLAYKIQTIKTK